LNYLAAINVFALFEYIKNVNRLQKVDAYTVKRLSGKEYIRNVEDVSEPYLKS
jgi:16S rRNA U1498 N3-methylase RsmE